MTEPRSPTAAPVSGCAGGLGETMLNPLEHPEFLKRINYYSRLKKLAAYMEQHPGGAIDLSRASQIVCMERTAFCKFFKRAMGVNFIAFVQQWRISLAIANMLTTDASLTTIAYGVGFGNMNSFERTFKRVTGSTPSAYRRRLLVASEIDLSH
jgi:AraC-like DNA-binding protein